MRVEETPPAAHKLVPERPPYRVVCILVLSSKATSKHHFTEMYTAAGRWSGTNNNLFQLLLQVTLLQVAREVMAGKQAVQAVL